MPVPNPACAGASGVGGVKADGEGVSTRDCMLCALSFSWMGRSQ